MAILVVVLSFPGFLEDLLSIEAFMGSVPVMNIIMNIITIMEEEDLVVDTIMEEEEEEDLAVAMVDITN